MAENLWKFAETIRYIWNVGKYTTYNTTIDYFIGTLLVMHSVAIFRKLKCDVLFSDVHSGLHAQLKFSIKSNVTIANANTQEVGQASVKPDKWKAEKKVCTRKVLI